MPEDPAELYAVPEDEQLGEDPGLDPDHTAGAPADLTHVPEGDDDDIVYFDDDEQAEPDPDPDLDEHQEVSE